MSCEVFRLVDSFLGLCVYCVRYCNGFVYGRLAWLGWRLGAGGCCNIAFERRNVFIWISYLLLMNLLSAMLRFDDDESRKVVLSPPELAC
jgi:hypothetical protein